MSYSYTANTQARARRARSDMQNKIQTFQNNCDNAIPTIHNMKTQVAGFLDDLNSDRDLRACFLRKSNKIDELNYLVTDFEMASSATIGNEVEIVMVQMATVIV